MKKGRDSTIQIKPLPRPNRSAPSSDRIERMSVASSSSSQRECGGCTACCTVMRIREINKPRGRRCPHQTGEGCGVYGDRPDSCREFFCVWLRDGKGILREDERPDQVGLVLSAGPIHAGRKQVLRIHEVFPDASQSERAQRLIRRLARMVPVNVVKCPEPPLIEIRYRGRKLPASTASANTEPSRASRA